MLVKLENLAQGLGWNFLKYSSCHHLVFHLCCCSDPKCCPSHAAASLWLPRFGSWENHPKTHPPLNKKNMSTPWAISGKNNGKQDGFNKNNFCWKSPGLLVWGVLAKSNPHLLLWFARFPTLLFFWGTSTGPKRWRSLLRSLGLGSVLEKSGEIWANGIQ